MCICGPWPSFAQKNKVLLNIRKQKLGLPELGDNVHSGIIECAQNQEMLQATALPVLVNYPETSLKLLKEAETSESDCGHESTFSSGGQPP